MTRPFVQTTSSHGTPLLEECVDRALGLSGHAPDDRSLEQIAVDVRREWDLHDDSPLMTFYVDGRRVSEDEFRLARDRQVLELKRTGTTA